MNPLKIQPCIGYFWKHVLIDHATDTCTIYAQVYIPHMHGCLLMKESENKIATLQVLLNNGTHVILFRAVRISKLQLSVIT